MGIRVRISRDLIGNRAAPTPLVYMDQSPNFAQVDDCARSTSQHNGMDTGFPAATIARLRRSGVMVAPLPRSEGGLGWGTEDAGALPLSDALQAIGYGSLAAGRIYEAHVNAIALIFQYGNARIRSRAADAVRDGHLFALWVAPSAEPVRAFRSGPNLQITGRKAFCTAAGVATWAVITAHDEDNDERMILIDASQNNVDTDATVDLHGMKSTSTKAMKIDCEVPADHCIGNAGDYLHEPDFSAGAWRTSAVTVGGLQALVDETIRQLRARDRHANPHQAARIGQMLIKSHTAAMWIGSVVREAITHYDNPRHLIGYVNLARLAIEQACLDVIPLVQRSLGLTSLTVGNPVEAMMRDLVTYLRQPAADEILTEAAITFAQTTNPTTLGAIS
jgi:alkylation response protein AidB-like acyl-CoA dehydrogenase